MRSQIIQGIYLDSCYCIGLKKEGESSLAKYYDRIIIDELKNIKSYEKMEVQLSNLAIEGVISKSKFLTQDLDLFVGSDLLNQAMISNYLMKSFPNAFLSPYAACASLGASIATLISYMQFPNVKNGLVFSSSLNQNSEKTFRYPIEYGVKRKESATYTVSGSFALIFTKEKRKIKVGSFTIGRVIDYGLKDSNDFGSVMAISAYDTLIAHLKQLNLNANYYDAIVTGDLSTIGSKIFLELCQKDNLEIKKHFDCGLLIYDVEKQNVFMGGSGPSCCGILLSSYFYQKLLSGEYSKILFIATGALISLGLHNQKCSIPSISHAFSLERCL